MLLASTSADMEKPEAQAVGSPRRKILTMGISTILVEKGFVSADKAALETLTEMLQSLIVEIGQSSRNYCELSGRTVPVIGDVVMALINMGISIQGLESFGTRNTRSIIQAPQQLTSQKQMSLLQAGSKCSHPPHIPGFLPVLPDPHAYIRTPTHKQPVTEYEAIREKAAIQKRDVEKALTKFLSKTTDTHSLFDTEDNIFPLIAFKPTFPPYLAALNPTDQVFDFEELEYHYQVANRTEDAPSKDNDNDSGNEDENDEKTEKEIKAENELSQIKPNSATNNAILNNPNIDNPYLRAATLPKKIKQDLTALTSPATNFMLNAPAQ